jgi:membrane protein
MAEGSRLGVRRLAGAFTLGVAAGAAVALREWKAPHAKAPAAPPAPGAWRDIVLAAAHDFGADRITAAAAAVTFFILLALFPALSAFVSLFGLFGDVAKARTEIMALGGVLPAGAISVVGDALARLGATNHGALGAAFVLSLTVSLWSANAGAKALIDALNVAFEARERRGFIRLNLVSLAFTVGAVALAVAGATVTIAVSGRLTAASVLRWPVGLAAIILLLQVLYRFAPCRPRGGWRWISPGAVLAACGWIVMSAAFTWYVAHFGSYDRTYGSLGAAVGFLTWIWLSLMVVLFGAELNSEWEKAQAAEAARITQA